MALKEFKFQGKTIEELQELSDAEFSLMIPSRRRRTLLRGYDEERKAFIEKVKKKNNVKTHFRDVIIMPFMAGKTIQVHNGKGFESVVIQNEMIGQCLGEFALTRARAKHTSVGVTNKPKK